MIFDQFNPSIPTPFLTIGFTMKHYFLIMITTLLTGCIPHLSQQQCQMTNWHDQGYRDGSSGNAPTNLGQSVEDCAGFGIKVDRGQYQTGWNQGAQAFCTPNSATGFADGQAGKPLSDINSRMPICLQAHVPLNLASYKTGHQKGQISYCSYENGAARARQGKSLPLDLCATHNPREFNAGYVDGMYQLCGLPQNGFALGKDNKAYPDSCNPDEYPAFHAEYDRGHAIGQRLAELNERKSLEDLSGTLLNLATIKHGFRTTTDGYYELGNDTSESAKKDLEILNSHVREAHQVDREISNLQGQY